MKGPVQSVEVTYFVHATEDPVKLSAAVSSMLSVATSPDEERMEGHYGNPITRVRYHITGDAAAGVLEGIAARLGSDARSRMRRSLAELLDEHSDLYLRFDKQRLVEGSLEEGTGDAVRVKVKLRRYLVRGGVMEFYLRVLFSGGT